MNENDANRNLLYGILALQMDFVSREDLIAAASAWVKEKSLPLSQHLLQRGAITEDTHAVLAPLVDKHLELHNHNTAQSLAAVSTIQTWLPDEIKRLNDDDLNRSLASLAPQEGESDPFRTLTVDSKISVDRSARFQTLRLHAEGGLGQVSVARDTELNREVALKRIRQEYSDNQSCRARFVLEAEVTGQLEHPGIVPIYALGEQADGRPYYAMQFIRGSSLAEAIEQFHSDTNNRWKTGSKALALRTLLGRLVDVCHAIDYAHSRGVLHRDIKPNNIMLGRFGETLMVDWGLARAGQRAEAPVHISDEVSMQISSTEGAVPTALGEVIGTPAYMSPEQAAGRTDLVGPASDVYSIGATLYCVLVGRPPVEGDTALKVLQKVKAAQVAAPREANESIPKGLDAICRKAMAASPSDRYASAGELARDLESWLADEPNTARRDSVWDRSRRWMRGHQAAVTGVASAALVALVALSVGVVALNSAQKRERRLKDAATANFQRAELHFAQARSAVDRFFTVVSEETLLNQPGFEGLRNRLLQEALGFYHTFVSERADDAELQRELALAHYRIGLIQRDLVSSGDALASFDRARSMQESLLAIQPDEADLAFEYSNTLNAIGHLHDTLGNIEDAAEAFADARDLRRELVERAPDNRAFQRRYANSLMNLGILAQRQRDTGQVVSLIDSAQDIRRALLEQRDTLDVRRDLAAGFYNLALFELREDNVASGERYLQSALESFEQVVERDPLDLRNKQRLARCYQLMAQSTVDSEAALAYLEQASSIAEELALRSPEVAEYRSTLAAVYLDMASLREYEGNVELALRTLEQALSLLDELRRQEPQVPLHQREYAMALGLQGVLLAEAGDATAARPKLDQAAEILRAYLEEFPDDVSATEHLELIEAVLAQVRDRDGA